MKFELILTDSYGVIEDNLRMFFFVRLLLDATVYIILKFEKLLRRVCLFVVRNALRLANG